MKWKSYINSQGTVTTHLIKKSGKSLCGRKGKPLKKSKSKIKKLMGKCKACIHSLAIQKRDIHISCGRCHIGYNYKKTTDFLKFISEHTHQKSGNPS